MSRESVVLDRARLHLFQLAIEGFVDSILTHEFLPSFMGPDFEVVRITSHGYGNNRKIDMNEMQHVWESLYLEKLN